MISYPAKVCYTENQKQLLRDGNYQSTEFPFYYKSPKKKNYEIKIYFKIVGYIAEIICSCDNVNKNNI